MTSALYPPTHSGRVDGQRYDRGARSPKQRLSVPVRTRLALVLLLALGLSACGPRTAQPNANSTVRPETGTCRTLLPADLDQSANASPVVPCRTPHTAETYAIGTFPAALTADKEPDDKLLGAYVYPVCQQSFIHFLGADDSLALRAAITWAWFRPSDQAWRKGAHWWRCDVVGGGHESPTLQRLPTSAKGLLLGKPADRWLLCANGATVYGSPKVPCSHPHTWRAVTTIVLGGAPDPYPGDKVVESRTRDYCNSSVGAWLGYPVNYDYGYTWFHEAEWKTGNRRSICWAKTDR